MIKKLKNTALYLLSASLLLTSVWNTPVFAAKDTDSRTESTYETSRVSKAQSEQERKADALTASEREAIDGGDAEYWKYYDAEGNLIDRSVNEENSSFANGGKNGESGILGYSEDGYAAQSGTSQASEQELTTVVSPYDGNTYSVLAGYDISHGVDVSDVPVNQKNIDWAKVKEAGVDYAIIRCGRRTYGTGELGEDTLFQKNVEGALAAGLKVGVYIFSQAINVTEAKEEAGFCLNMSKAYLKKLDLPIVMDVEYVNTEDKGRLYQAGLTLAEQTEVCQAFCRRIEQAGYQAMVYGNKSMLTDEMKPSVLTDAGYQMWLARYNVEAGTFEFPYHIWQYSQSGSVPGITDQDSSNKANADLNFIFTKNQDQAAPVWKKAASSDFTHMELYWENVPYADGYEIQRRSAGGEWSTLALLEAGAAIHYTDTSVTNGVTYEYRIRTRRMEAGNPVYGDFSKTISAATVLGAPVLKSTKSINYKTVQLNWEKVTGADGYRVYRKTSGGSWTNISSEAGTTSLSFKDEKAVTGKTCYYTVRAYQLINGKKVFGRYDTKGIKGTAVLPVPKLKSTASVNYKTIKLSWEKVTGANGYRIYRKTSGGEWKKLKDVKDVLSYKDASAVTGKTYYYTVRAYRNVDDQRVYSSYYKKGISGKALPSAPAVSLKSTQKGKVNVSWNKISGASGYAVFCKTSSKGELERIKTIKSGKTVSCTVSATSGKTRYYTVRAYRTVGKTNIYSKYKEPVKIKVK
ncbi:MAG: GH25 family lysozyme [Lachnospiraceae bacterium]|nr:GH25 family lysozyme [Lachnospiraceae bacterium]